MPNWNHIVEKHCRDLLTRDGYSFFYEDGITDRVMGQICERIDFVFPQEFQELYAVYNGFGTKPQQSRGLTWWVCVPIQNIPALIDSTNYWFKETHIEYVDRFVPFVDFGNGDYVGYLLDENRLALPGLYFFEHDKYDADDDELEFGDFIVKTSDSLESYLLSMKAY